MVSTRRLSVSGNALLYNVKFVTHMEDGTYATKVKVLKVAPGQYKAEKSNAALDNYGGE